MKLTGKGLIVDIGRDVGFPDYGDVEIIFGLNFPSPPPPASAGGYVVPYDAPITGEIAWYELTAELLAAVTGEALSTGAVKRTEAEPHQVPLEEPYEVTLASTSNVARSEVVIADDNSRLVRAAGPPGPGEYGIAGATLTFDAARAGYYVYVDYFYSDEDNGKTLVLSPFGLPGEFKLLADLAPCDAASNLYDRGLVLVAERCRRTGPLASGPAGGEFASLGFAFAVDNRAPGDVVVYFP
jgi:hypothetical protein